MIVWRICKAKHADTAFSGLGAEKVGGRWNSPGRSVVYTSENLSLATLELFVNVNPRVLPVDLVVIQAKLPKRFSKTTLDAAELPTTWRDYPAPEQLQHNGHEWLEKNSTFALIVPSAVNPLERNILLNPAHSQMKAVTMAAPIPFEFDPRRFG